MQVTQVLNGIASGYSQQLGFKVDQQHLPAFAQVSVRGLKLILSSPGASGSRPMPDGRKQEPGDGTGSCSTSRIYQRASRR